MKAATQLLVAAVLCAVLTAAGNAGAKPLDNGEVTPCRTCDTGWEIE